MLCKVGCEEICRANWWIRIVSSAILALALGYILIDNMRKIRKDRED